MATSWLTNLLGDTVACFVIQFFILIGMSDSFRRGEGSARQMQGLWWGAKSQAKPGCKWVLRIVIIAM